jgi:hypothetical protein
MGNFSVDDEEGVGGPKSSKREWEGHGEELSAAAETESNNPEPGRCSAESGSLLKILIDLPSVGVCP